MTYQRILPRDLFNEAKLLKCLGRLALLIHNELCELQFVHVTQDWQDFRIYKDFSDGSIYCDNLLFFAPGRKRVKVYLPENNREPYPLLCRFDGSEEELAVFNDDGSLSDDFQRIVLQRSTDATVP